jgi:hypothetical protein
MTHDARLTLLHARQLQDGSAMDVLTQGRAAPSLLFHGQPCQMKAETLALLRAERQRRTHTGVSDRVSDGLWSPAQARRAAWLLRN